MIWWVQKHLKNDVSPSQRGAARQHPRLLPHPSPQADGYSHVVGVWSEGRRLQERLLKETSRSDLGRWVKPFFFEKNNETHVFLKRGMVKMKWFVADDRWWVSDLWATLFCVLLPSEGMTTSACLFWWLKQTWDPAAKSNGGWFVCEFWLRFCANRSLHPISPKSVRN